MAIDPQDDARVGVAHPLSHGEHVGATHPVQRPHSRPTSGGVKDAGREPPAVSGKPETCAGAYTDGPIGHAAGAARDASIHLGALEHTARAGGWRQRHQARRQLPDATTALEAAGQHLAQLAATEAARLQHQIVSSMAHIAAGERVFAATSQRWEQTVRQHRATDQRRQRLSRPVSDLRRRLERPRLPVSRRTRHKPAALQ